MSEHKDGLLAEADRENERLRNRISELETEVLTEVAHTTQQGIRTETAEALFKEAVGLKAEVKRQRDIINKLRAGVLT